MSAHREALVRAGDRQRQGDADGALRYCREALALAPGDAETNAMLGNLLAIKGSFDEAERHFAVAAEAGPEQAVYANLLGECRGRLGHLDDAIAAFKEALRRSPDDHRARCNLAIAYAATGDFTRAEPEFEAALDLRPDDAALAQQLAATYAQLGKLDEADRLLRRIIARDPRNLPALFNLAANLLNQGVSREAITHLRTALDIEPDYVVARLALARALHAEHRLEEALEEAMRCASAQSDAIPVLLEKAAIHFARMDIDEADATYRRVLELDLKSTEGRCGLAEIALYCKQPSAALDWLETANGSPVAARELALYAKAARIAGRDDDLAATLDEAIATPMLSARARKSLLMERGHLFDRNNDPAQAMDAWTRANECLPDRFDTDSHRQAIRAVIDRSENLPTSGIDDERPVLIIGMPRSGKSLVEQMLCSHPAVFGAGETALLATAAGKIRSTATCGANPDGTAEADREILGELATWYLDQLGAGAGGAARITESLPLNYLHVGTLRQLAPQARVIHCRRGASDLFLACFRKNFLNPDYDFSRSLESLARYYQSYLKLVDLWRERSGLRWLDVDYEALVSDTQPTLMQLVEFLDLPWDPVVMEYHRAGVPNTGRRDLIRSQVDERGIGIGTSYGKWLSAHLLGFES